MIVTAALAWYDEAPEDLDRFVRALPAAVDRLVAVDGGYARYPGAAARSPMTEEAAIVAACHDIGLPVDVRIPDRIWKGQIEKRTYLMQAAAEGSDWVFTLDADHILHGVREAFRHEVEGLVAADRVEIDFYTTMNYDLPLSETASTEWHSRLAGETRRMGLLLRAVPGIRVERFHWCVSGLKRGERVWMYGGDDSYPKVTAHYLEAPLFIEHRCLYRRRKNILANREFCNDRDQIIAATGQEDVVEVAA